MAGERVLVVDDEPIIVNVITEVLRASGHEVEGCGSAESALEILKTQAFGLIVTDVMMPGLSGIEMLKGIRELDPNMVVIVITGHATLDVALEALEWGARAFLTKPFTPAELRTTVHDALMKARTSAEDVRLRALIPLLESSRRYISTRDPGDLARQVGQDAARMVGDRDAVMVALPPPEGESAPDVRWPPEGDLLRRNAAQLWAALAKSPHAGATDITLEGPDGSISVRSVPLLGSDRGEGLLALAIPSDGAWASASTDYAVGLLGQLAGAALESARLSQERESFVVALSTALANALDARDSETGGHSQRLMELSIALGHELHLGREGLDQLRFGALLHDIGKIGVPDEILHKPGRLSDAEWEIMRRHPGIGERIIAPVPALEPVAMIIRHHHEWFDGSGYPDGLSAADIPILARAISVVDSYCTMTEDRPYRPARTHQAAVEELIACGGTQFDPAIVDGFLRLFEPPGSVPVDAVAEMRAIQTPAAPTPRMDSPAR